MHFSRCMVAASAALFVYVSSFCQRAAEDVLRWMTGPSLETGTVFDAVLSVNYCAILDCVSVIAVRGKCDEKCLRAPAIFGTVNSPRYIPWLDWATRPGCKSAYNALHCGA